jgi:hypothetical protein
MFAAGFDPAFPASKWPQTTLSTAITGIGLFVYAVVEIINIFFIGIGSKLKLSYRNPFVRSIGNYTLPDLHRQYKKYLHKRPKHILL